MKEQKIKSIKQRIYDEHRKYSKPNSPVDWMETAARKIYSVFIQDLEKERDYYKSMWLEDLLESFSQACWFEDLGQYDHMCNSTWEHAQRELIKHDVIKKEDCYRS